MPPAGTAKMDPMIIEPMGLDKPPRKVTHTIEPEIFEPAPLSTALIAYLNLGLLVIFGYVRDFMRLWGYESNIGAKEYGNEVCLHFN